MAEEEKDLIDEGGEDSGNGDGGDRDWLPDDLREHPALTKFKDPASVAKGYAELEKVIGSSVRIPSKYSTDDEFDEFYDKYNI